MTFTSLNLIAYPHTSTHSFIIVFHTYTLLNRPVMLPDLRDRTRYVTPRGCLHSFSALEVPPADSSV